MTPGLSTVVSNKIARAFISSGATRAVALDISKAFERVWHAGLVHKLTSMEFQVRYLVLVCLFSVIDGFEWYWMGSHTKHIYLILEFPEAPFLVITFSCYTLMTFPMLFLILISMLMRLLSTVSVIRQLICGKN